MKYVYKELGGVERTVTLTTPEGVVGPLKVLSFIDPANETTGYKGILIFELVEGEDE
jgi:hypothetical protein